MTSSPSSRLCEPEKVIRVAFQIYRGPAGRECSAELQALVGDVDNAVTAAVGEPADLGIAVVAVGHRVAGEYAVPRPQYDGVLLRIDAGSALKVPSESASGCSP